MEQATGKLADALAKAQAMFRPIKKDKTAKVRMKSGGEYSYNYADLSSVIDATIEGRTVNGLSVTQLPMFQGEHFILRTELMHVSGETKSCDWPLPAPHTPAQEMGSALTYARRYSMSAILGVASEDDDDGAAGNEARPGQRQQTAKTEPVKANGNGKAATSGKTAPAAGTLYLVNPNSGEFETFVRMSDFLARLEDRLNKSDEPLAWYDQNKAAFANVQGKLANSEPGKAHCDRIADLVGLIQKAQTAPINEPDYASA